MDKYTSWQSVPDHLKTRTALKKQGLRPKRGTKPVAQKISVWRSKTSVYDLYDTKDCEPVKPLTPAQRAALKKAQEASLKARTCQGCGYVQALGGHYRGKAYVQDGLCPACYDAHQRKDDRAEAAAWARRIVNGLAEGVIEANEVVILDSETTDLHGEIIDLAIINLAGEVVYNQRFYPVSAIAPGAQAVHGLTAEMLAGEPRFADEWAKIRQILEAARLVLIYNAAYDTRVLQHTCQLHDVESIELPAQCVMEQYSQWYGEWSSYHRDYRWQSLPGGDHTALGDCRATLEVVQSMAAWTDGAKKV